MSTVPFIEAVFPGPPRKWISSRRTFQRADSQHKDVYWVFQHRGFCLPRGQTLYHACPLSIAWIILREGLLAGEGHHLKNKKTVRGMFFITGTQMGEVLFETSYRSTITRCPEYQHSGGWPTGWSTPVVIAFTYPGEVTKLADVGHCQKNAVQLSSFPVRDMMDGAITLFIMPELLAGFRNLHRLRDLGQHGGYIVCGGKSSDALAGVVRGGCCANCILFRDLSSSSWIRSEKKKFWYCSRYRTIVKSRSE